VAGDRVAAAAHRDQQVALTAEADGFNHVIGASAAGDQRRTPVDRSVPDSARLLIPFLARTQEGTTKACSQLPERPRVERRGGLDLADRHLFLPLKWYADCHATASRKAAGVSVSATSVRKVLPAAGLRPVPERETLIEAGVPARAGGERARL